MSIDSTEEVTGMRRVARVAVTLILGVAAAFAYLDEPVDGTTGIRSLLIRYTDLV